MKETIEKLMKSINEFDVILDGKIHEILSYYYDVTNAIGFIKKDNEIYLIDENLNEIKL